MHSKAILGTPNNFGMKPRILPFLEQNAIYNAINWTGSLENAWGSNDTIATTQINVFLCPSDGNIPVGNYAWKNKLGSFQTAYGSYPNNLGTDFQHSYGKLDGPAYRTNEATPNNHNAAVSLAMITDGTSNTAMFSEWVRGKNQSASPQDGVHQIYNTGTNAPSAVTTASIDLLVPSCQNSKTIYASYDHKGQKWANMQSAEGGGYTHIMLPNTKACVYSDLLADPFQTMICASSYHSGGVNLVTIDGSVKFIKNSVSKTTWRALATMAGGEVIDASSY